MRLKTSVENARKLLLSIPHQTCARAISHCWKVNPDGTVAAQSVLWLFCWGKTGMNSEIARRAAAEVFDEIMPISFGQLDALVDHEYARRARYASHNIENELKQILAKHGVRVLN